MEQWKVFATKNFQCLRCSITPKPHPGRTTPTPISRNSWPPWPLRSAEKPQPLDRQRLSPYDTSAVPGLVVPLTGGCMTKADLVEQVTAAIARTSGPLISHKDAARA